MGVLKSWKRCQSKALPMTTFMPHWLAAYMLGRGTAGMGAVSWGPLKKKALVTWGWLKSIGGEGI